MAGARDREVTIRSATFTYANLVPFLAFALFPFYFMLITSLKSNAELYNLKSIPFLVQTGVIADHYQYLFLDAVTLRVKTPDGTRRRHALVAYGRTATGQRELIDYRLVRQECQATWEPFLINLAGRGLTGAALHLITTDGHAGLHAALILVYPQIPRQACWVHVLRNVAQRLRVRDRARCLAMARRIYHAPTRSAAERALEQWVRAWQPTAPAAVACVLRDWEALLAFYAVPEHDWRRVRTTNAIERAFREVRRRTRPMSCFTNTASCDRIMFAVIWAFNQQAAGRPLSWETTQKS